MEKPKINYKIEKELNRQFPKGKCKERGNALVLFAIAQMEINKLEKQIEDLKNK